MVVLIAPETQLWCNEGANKNKKQDKSQKNERVKGPAELNGSGRSYGKRRLEGNAHEEGKSDGTSEKRNGAKRNTRGTKQSELSKTITGSKKRKHINPCTIIEIPPLSSVHRIVYLEAFWEYTRSSKYEPR